MSFNKLQSNLVRPRAFNKYVLVPTASPQTFAVGTLIGSGILSAVCGYTNFTLSFVVSAVGSFDLNLYDYLDNSGTIIVTPFGTINAIGTYQFEFGGNTGLPALQGRVFDQISFSFTNVVGANTIDYAELNMLG